MDVMIEARNLTKRYGPQRALDNASFEVRKGEVLGFLGPNGAGKSTTMKILTCFIAPTEGTAKVNGHDIWEDPLGVRASIGYLPESTPLYTEMLVLEYLEFMAQMRGLKGDAARKRIKKAVEQTHLGDVIAKEIRQLSKGYRQRVGIAQSLVHEPPILILDEPMSGLDPNQAIEIRDLIRDIGKERTVILSTHNLAEVQVTCQRVLIIAKGKIVADDTPAALTSRGRNRYVVHVDKASASEAKGYRDGGDVLGAFRSLPGVETVREVKTDDTKATALEIVSRTSEDLRAELFRAAVEKGLVLLELRTRGENLEQVFRDLTLGEDTAIAAAEEDEDDEDEDEDEEPSDRTESKENA
ncbi:ATP-binding cassette domain-containing protein [Sandaracinus amylolyticus]|uniref:ATP-binding cassette domain-containing protein n=1 Tax=Sandaracinus amylolyticus TaxID=927083 RepID=UPI001F4357DC|nr:ATP-binding cassette domain-containing protein [Sandaracinus amylolyticus]UJR79678.1 Gliding motility-associated ABC transporter ATP-binding subunit GldA [Sandaracinus amylolyticus]